MLRNVWERQAEIALLRAIGFSAAGIRQLVLWENAFLLSWGLVAGAASALVAMTPHLRTTGADVPWGSVALLFVVVFACGMLAASLAMRFAVRVPIVTTLRGE
jgi:ABC-type antimicrobial peptide transport system permease subunit